MRIQRKLENTQWVDIDEDRIEKYLDMILTREAWYAPRVNREPMTTREQVIEFLATGKVLPYDTDWYAQIRDVDILKPQQPQPVIEMILCNCGHRCMKHVVMMTSHGTSCPNCYDRMSE